MQPEQPVQYPQPQGDSFDPVVSATEPSLQPQDDTQSMLVWQASEYIHDDKSGAWILGVLGVAGVLSLIAWLVVKSWSFVVLIVVMTLAVIVISRRLPRIIGYSLSSTDITIDQKQFSLQDFKFFGVVQEGALYSVRLVPHKRFMPMVSVYLPADQAEQIVDVLGSVMPMREIKLDVIDRIAERIRF